MENLAIWYLLVGRMASSFLNPSRPLLLQSEYNFCLSLSRSLLLQSKYNFYLSLSRPLLPQSEYTFSLNPSRPYILPREREGEYLFYHFIPTLSKKSVCDQLLIRSILVLLFNFEVPLKKLSKKKLKQKKEKKGKKNQKKQQQRRGFVCIFLSFVRWCFVITFVSRLTSLAQSWDNGGICCSYQQQPCCSVEAFR
jgi:hypothetical protein